MHNICIFRYYMYIKVMSVDACMLYIYTHI